MTKTKLFLGAVLLFAVAYAGVFGALFRLEHRERELLQGLVRLGEKKALLATDAMKPLWQACEGKLTAGGTQSVSAYIAWMESSKKPTADETIDQSVVALERDWLYTEEKFRLTNRRPASEGAWGLRRFQEHLDLFEWSTRLSHLQRSVADLEQVRYLVVARYDWLTMPRVDSEGFRAGLGRYGARVLAVPSGEVLCEGRGVPTMPSEVRAGGSGDTTAEARADAEERVADLVPFVFAQGVLASPLHMVCSVGGSRLCDETAHWAGYHPDVYGP